MVDPISGRPPLEAFLEQYWQDRSAGRVLAVSEYLRRFPGDTDGVVTRYVTLERGRGVEEKASSSDRLGSYRIEKELGRGGQGVVYLAHDSRLKRPVALKVLSNLGPGSEDVVRRFRREAEVASRLQHPGICGVYDAGVESDVPFIAMQYVPGETVADLIARSRSSVPAVESSTLIIDLEEDPETRPEQGPQPPETSITRKEIDRVLGLIEGVARALHAAHEAGIVHRDIKPGNVMVSAEGQPVILDFGLARADDADVQTLTRTGDLFGTPAYMSPEQVAGGSVRLDRRSDVYSLGATLYECLTLERPFQAPTRQGLYQAILTTDAPRARKRNPRIPPELEVVLETALEKDPDHRYRPRKHWRRSCAGSAATSRSPRSRSDAGSRSSAGRSGTRPPPSRSAACASASC